MAATIHGASRYGMADDATATGLLLGDLSYNYLVDITYAKNHIGNDVSVAFANDSTEVTCSGVVAVKATGLVPDLGAAITFANDAVDSLGLKSKNLFTTPTANA